MNRPLSPGACDRMERDLADLRRMVARRPIRRAARARATLAIGAAAALAAWGAALTFRAAETGTLTPVAADAGQATFRTGRPEHPVVIVLATDESILSRSRASTTPAVREIDDDGLRAALADAGRPTGLVRIGGRVLLASELHVREGAEAASSDPRPLPE